MKYSKWCEIIRILYLKARVLYINYAPFGLVVDIVIERSKYLVSCPVKGSDLRGRLDDGLNFRILLHKRGGICTELISKCWL